ncbi:DNA alkylation repair protein [Pseudalkalibacillus sp. NRS-1564]|uniref:DNA alkylation repair protein n=1 Tax=Pseudalkalibacillus sp. NRS-1564 TaxID=3233900 RepID=UPI003D283201
MLTVSIIQKELEPLQNPEQSKKMEKYMRNQFPFLGIKTPERRKAVINALKIHGKPDLDTLKELLEKLWALPEREYQNAALDLLDRVKRFPKDYIDLIEQLIITKSWWDTVDGLAVHSAGIYFQQYPDQIAPITEEWVNSPNLWLNRSALLFQLSYKDSTDFDRLKRYILLLKDSNEFFIQKAIGWSLREYSKIDSEIVKNFLENYTLPPLSKREASKFINKQKK